MAYRADLSMARRCVEDGNQVLLVAATTARAASFPSPDLMFFLIAEVIKEGDDSFRFYYVYGDVRTRTGEEGPDHQVRVAMRFHTHAGVMNAQFTQDGKKSFRRMTNETQDDLTRQTSAGQLSA
jgi:hypothetical protein